MPGKGGGGGGPPPIPGEGGGPLVQRAEEVVVVVVVPFQAMEEVAGDQQTLQVAVEEVAAGAGTG